MYKSFCRFSQLRDIYHFHDNAMPNIFLQIWIFFTSKLMNFFVSFSSDSIVHFVAIYSIYSQTTGFSTPIAMTSLNVQQNNRSSMFPSMMSETVTGLNPNVTTTLRTTTTTNCANDFDASICMKLIICLCFSIYTSIFEKYSLR